MAEGIIVIVDLGHENPKMIQEDVESFGVQAVICDHDVDEVYLERLGDIKGFIFDGGPHKKIRGFRVDASQAIYEYNDGRTPVYSVDHAGTKGVDLYTWPEDTTERREHIEFFLKTKCKMI